MSHTLPTLFSSWRNYLYIGMKKRTKEQKKEEEKKEEETPSLTSKLIYYFSFFFHIHSPRAKESLNMLTSYLARIVLSYN